MRVGQKLHYLFLISILTFLTFNRISNQVKINVYRTYGSYTSNEDQEWYHVIGGPYDDEVNALIQTSDKGFAIVGSTRSYGGFSSDMWLVKTNSNGTPEWNQTYDKGTREEAHSIIQTSDGGYLIAGHIGKYYSSTDDTHDIWVIKTNSTGYVEWERLYDTSGNDVAFDLIQTHNEGFALAGWTDSFSKDKAAEMWLIQADANGTILWNQTYTWEKDAERNVAYTLIRTNDGGFVLLGVKGYSPEDILLVKTSENGTMEWNQTFGGYEDEEAWALLQTDDGGFLLTGWTKSFGSGGRDIWLIKTNNDGLMEWNQTYGGKDSEFAYNLIETSDGQFVLAGSSIMKINATGKVKWSSSLNRREYSVVKDILITSDDYFVFTGQNHVSRDENIYLAKFSETTLARKVPSFDFFLPILAVLIITIWIKRRRKIIKYNPYLSPK